MNGPEHYAEGGRVLAAAQDKGGDLIARFAASGSAQNVMASAAVVEAMVAIASAHFAAAQVAATIESADTLAIALHSQSQSAYGPTAPDSRWAAAVWPQGVST